MYESMLRKIYARGIYSSTIVSVPFASAAVRAMLPGKLELAAQQMTGPSQHPVLFLFGRNDKTHFNFLTWYQIQYLEFAVVIPWVQWNTAAAYRGPFLFTPRLYLNKWVPIVAGRIVYGYGKEKANIGADATAYRIADAARFQPLIAADFDPTTRPLDPAERARLTPLLQQPVVAQTPLGPYICSIFDWNLPNAELSSINATVTIQQAFLNGLAPSSYSVQGVEDMAAGGAFRITTHWKLSLPMGPERVKSASYLLPMA